MANKTLVNGQCKDLKRMKRAFVFPQPAHRLIEITRALRRCAMASKKDSLWSVCLRRLSLLIRKPVTDELRRTLSGLFHFLSPSQQVLRFPFCMAHPAQSDRRRPRRKRRFVIRMRGLRTGTKAPMAPWVPYIYFCKAAGGCSVGPLLIHPRHKLHILNRMFFS